MIKIKNDNPRIESLRTPALLNTTSASVVKAADPSAHPLTRYTYQEIPLHFNSYILVGK